MKRQNIETQFRSALWRHFFTFFATIGLVAMTTSSLQIPSLLLSKRRSSSILGTSEDVTQVNEAIELGRSQLSKYFDFPLDDWQLQAGGEILMGHNVVVCAPTGAGKTVCGEMALHVAMDRDLEGIYTTPLKALSNQKFAELRQIFGASAVGLSTGDVSINRQNAKVTVMTTEVYRNIAWRSSGPPDTKSLTQTDELSSKSNDLRKNAVVVLDEFHYMGLPGRGGVWEECVITSPAHTQIIGLSATLPNAVQLADWMQGVTGRKTILVEAPGTRPVPLKYLFATREGLFPLFRNPDAGPGSPLGLLGYRGDGVPPEGSKKKPRHKSEAKHDLEMEKEKLPRGLKVNPSLETIAQKRMQKVNRMLERQKARQRQGRSLDDDWDLYGNGRGRDRGRLPRVDQMSSREERKERERMLKREMRKAVPSLPILLSRLKEKNLLPAIFFIFSRAGCDQAADTIRNAFKGPKDPTVDIDFDSLEGGSNEKKKKSRQRANQKRRGGNVYEDKNGRAFRLSSNHVSEDIFSSLLEENQLSEFGPHGFIPDSPLSSENWKFYSIAGLLSYEEVRTVAGRVSKFNEDNPEIEFDDNIMEQFLFGVGSHHAGMLPAHKAFVETLFRANLMKVCFATETLAAGINMPARTTVVCSLAKRDGSGSMSLLETSNLLQMAGRAGRRGMDTAGTCVIVATPFESHDVAASILTNPIKPISSQFRPSYSLTVNLIARGRGKLDVAKQLVSKSFAMWEKRRREDEFVSASERDDVREVIESLAEEKFMSKLIEILDRQINKKSAKFDIAFLKYLVATLKDRELLKKSSKGYESVALTLELEKTTLGCLELEMKGTARTDQRDLDEEIFNFQQEDQANLLAQIDEQRQRVALAEKKVRKHTFTSIVDVAKEIMGSDTEDGNELSAVFESIGNTELLAEDLSKYAKSAVVIKRKLRKLAKANPDVDPESLLLRAEQVEEIQDTSWDDMLALTKVLVAYGCLTAEEKFEDEEEAFNNLEDLSFEVTPAGSDVGMLSFENSLWCFSAMGGTWDVIGASSKFDEMRTAMKVFEDDFDGDETDPESNVELEPYLPQQEAEELVSHLRFLSPGEMAGYVSCLVTGDTGRNSLSSIDIFQRLSSRQQRAIQVLLDATERLVDVQRKFSADEITCKCQFDLTNAEVVSAWANGCTWNEALEISGAAPGDLTRIIGRAMDAVRQFGSLKFKPLRKKDLDGTDVIVDPLSRGLHPEIRRICREAAKAMNRYPVKDPLPFEVEAEEEEDMFDENVEDAGEDGESTEFDGLHDTKARENTTESGEQH